MKRLLLLAALTVFTSEWSVGPAAAASRVCEVEMQAASARYEVPLGVLYAVGLTESGRKDSLQQFAMNLGGRAYFATGLDDALGAFAAARAEGVSLIDVGCMQINHYYHGDQFDSVARMFEPRANVDYAARLLKTLRQREGSWTLAVARYHAGPNNNPAQKRYVCAVIANMVAVGFGNWTDAARDFCR